MKALKLVIIVVAVAALFSALFLGYMGFFTAVTVSERELGPYTYVYERFVGPYWGTGKVFQRLESSLKLNGITTGKAIGIYYDDPARVSRDKLHSDCGYVIEGKEIEKIPDIKKKYGVAILPKKTYAVAEFPLKNTLSFMFGPSKAYPALASYAKAKGYVMSKGYELYLKDKIQYLMAAEK